MRMLLIHVKWRCLLHDTRFWISDSPVGFGDDGWVGWRSPQWPRPSCCPLVLRGVVMTTLATSKRAAWVRFVDDRFVCEGSWTGVVGIGRRRLAGKVNVTALHHLLDAATNVSTTWLDFFGTAITNKTAIHIFILLPTSFQLLDWVFKLESFVGGEISVTVHFLTSRVQNYYRLFMYWLNLNCLLLF